LDAAQIADIQRKYRCRLESLLSVDEGVGKVVGALAAKGELANTLLIFTSDNGYFHGEHRIPMGKGRLYEESIRVPLLMRGPGIPRGANVRDLAINADLAPTIVDAADATPGLLMDGRSLIPVAQQPGLDPGRSVLVEQPPGTGLTWLSPPFAAIRTQRYLYAEYTNGERELYDMANDPFELSSRHNSPAYGSVKAKLADRLHLLQSCAGATC
jgi:arylsulfatase A-like enzyme